MLLDKVEHEPGVSTRLRLLARRCGTRALCTLLLTGLSSMASAALERVGDFALLDAQGEFHQLSRYRHRQALALMTYDSRCSDPARVEALAALQARYEEAGVSFALLDTTGSSRQALQAIATTLPASLPLLEDGARLIPGVLAARSNDEVILLNPERLNVFFRGSDLAQLSATLDALEESPPADTRVVAAAGCEIEQPEDTAVPDYSSEVAPMKPKFQPMPSRI